MSDSFIAVRGYFSSGTVAGYLVRHERRRYWPQTTKTEWSFRCISAEEAYPFKSLKMAFYRVNSLRAVRDFLNRGGTWEIVEITPIRVLASKDDNPLKQLARAAI